MDVSFVNKYTVSKEGHRPFFVTPRQATLVVRGEKKAATKSTPRKSTAARLQKWNGAIRILGLCLAAVIIIMAFMQGMWPLAVVGGILAAIYAARMYAAHQVEREEEEKKVPPPSNAYSETGKWTRYVRFGDHIEVEDPDRTSTYRYSQITRITTDQAYITLWMDDESQVRVYRKGFIIGTLDSFEQFIMLRTGFIIGPGTEKTEENANASAGGKEGTEPAAMDEESGSSSQKTRSAGTKSAADAAGESAKD